MAGVGASGVTGFSLTSTGTATGVVADPGDAVAGAGVACTFAAAPGAFDLLEDDGVTILFEDDGVTALTED